jgi:hypothetical protein
MKHFAEEEGMSMIQGQFHHLQKIQLMDCGLLSRGLGKRRNGSYECRGCSSPHWTGCAARMHMGTGNAVTLSEADARELMAQCPDVALAAPVVRGGGQVVYENNNWATIIVGVTPPSLRFATFLLFKERPSHNMMLTLQAKSPCGVRQS